MANHLRYTLCDVSESVAWGSPPSLTLRGGAELAPNPRFPSFKRPRLSLPLPAKEQLQNAPTKVDQDQKGKSSYSMARITAIESGMRISRNLNRQKYQPVLRERNGTRNGASTSGDRAISQKHSEGTCETKVGLPPSTRPGRNATPAGTAPLISAFSRFAATAMPNIAAPITTAS